ncbi:hypothetical protein CAEBREN_25985 [Caenorhabditis brenneri]|uniref:Uncharacterized protein n=1 Tax=Caenorhabditis brenneri TaxID=135651 RepID=G0NQH7_CAEBE|nr:hypothetical protein CAEBREN_25985 [Caenorhabditis brenneri]
MKFEELRDPEIPSHCKCHISFRKGK